MLGHGYYNQHSHAQGAANKYALPLLKAAVAAIDRERTGNNFVIADYGAAQGQNSLEPVGVVIDELEARWPTRPAISVVHTDLATNDFTALFQTVLQSPQSYLAGRTNVFPFASGTSIYQQIFPANHVSVGYSAIVTHWLSRKPADIPGHIWSVRAEGEARRRWAEQAAEDWRSFLGFRAAELKPSGQLVIVGSGADDAGNSGAEALLDLANEVLQEMVDTGELPVEAYRAMAIPTYYRTAKEWTECLGPGSSLSNHLRLLEHQPAVLTDPYFEAYRENGDAQAFARAYASFLRAFSEPCLFKNLPGQRTAAELQRLTDSFYGKVEMRIAQKPEAYVCRWQLMLLRIARLDGMAAT